MAGMATPLDYPLTLTRGDTFEFGLGLKLADGSLADLTGYTLRLQIRFAVAPAPTPGSPAGEVTAGDLIHPTASFASPPAPAGATQVRIDPAPPAATELWPVGVHLYDAELTSPAVVRHTYAGGTLTVKGDVTR